MVGQTLRDGWYYRHNGEKIGPLSRTQLGELLSAGLLRPLQAVWRASRHGLLFLPAAAAAAALEGEANGLRDIRAS